MKLIKLLLIYCIIACPLVLSGWVYHENDNYWPMAGYIMMSVVAYVMYFIDKRRAVGGRWRISERFLHLLELIGGWPGAMFAQVTINHKSSKLSYQVIFWLIILLHGAGWWFFVLGGW